MRLAKPANQAPSLLHPPYSKKKKAMAEEQESFQPPQQPAWSHGLWKRALSSLAVR